MLNNLELSQILRNSANHIYVSEIRLVTKNVQANDLGTGTVLRSRAHDLAQL